jgi:hypothetical protein
MWRPEMINDDVAAIGGDGFFNVEVLVPGFGKDGDEDYKFEIFVLLVIALLKRVVVVVK